MNKYWTNEHTGKIDHITNFQDMVNLAMEVIETIPGDIGMVSGPISTGGLGSIEKNFKSLVQPLNT